MHGEVQALVRLPRTTRDLVFRREPAFLPTGASLAAFAGVYDSDELDVRYEIVAGDSGLIVKQRKKIDMRLEPAFTDAFTGGGRTFMFARDASGRVSGLRLTDGRARGIQFARARSTR